MVGARASEPAPLDLSSTWNQFSAASKVFTTAMNEQPRGTISATQYLAWDRVKACWRPVERGFNIYFQKR